MIRRYSELKRIDSFEDRFAYLKLTGVVGDRTFGYDRYLNQDFYRSEEWRRIRDLVIVRDLACDLGIEDRNISGTIIIHHMNPIDVGDILEHTDYLIDPEYLIATSNITHNAIHYGDETLLPNYSDRVKDDTCLWR